MNYWPSVYTDGGAATAAAAAAVQREGNIQLDRKERPLAVSTFLSLSLSALHSSSFSASSSFRLMLVKRKVDCVE